MGMQLRSQEFTAAKAHASTSWPPAGIAPAAASIQFWSGISGKHYVHTVFDLITCPRLPACVYVLAHRGNDGKSRVLRIGTVSAEAASLNLAEIRHRAAQLGANEVHAHLLCDNANSRSTIAADLQAGLFAELAAEPTPVPEHLC